MSPPLLKLISSPAEIFLTFRRRFVSIVQKQKTMKFPAISVLFLTSVSATSEIEDLQNGYNVEPRKKTLTETDSIDAHAAKRAQRKTTATHTGRRSLQGSKCTPVDLDADALVERVSLRC